MRHRATLSISKDLDDMGLYHVEGPDDDLAEYYAKEPERWRGRYFVFKRPGETPGTVEQRCYEMTQVPSGPDGLPVFQWNRVGDPEIWKRVR